MSVYSNWVQWVGVGKVGGIVSGYSGWVWGKLEGKVDGCCGRS